MVDLDPYFERIAEYVNGLRKDERKVRTFDCPSAVSQLLINSPIKIGPDAGSGIILREDAFIELGNPKAGSCNFIIYTKNPSLIKDGRIHLIGPDIQEKPGQSLPFGQVLLVGGKALEEDDQQVLEKSQYISGQVEGYMIRSAAQHIWSRVSKDAVKRGFNFNALGSALMAILKTEVPKIHAMEVIFVTSGKEDVEKLNTIASQINKINREIKKKKWRLKGIDIDCTLELDCSRCSEKLLCDNIREVLKIRKRQTNDHI
jgi:CO dehydrogenase/acetyl-CoA synthase beta subunit